MIFLIQYEPASGRLIGLQRFEDADRASAEESRFALELEHARMAAPIEVVLLDAASEEALRKTHRRYFETLEELTRRSGPQADGVGATG